MPKTLEDLPHFLVTDVGKGKATLNGYDVFELSGAFDKLDGVNQGTCSLLLPERGCIFSDFSVIDTGTKKASCLAYYTPESEPKILGCKLPYLSSFWQPYHVWMVVEPNWRWQTVLFEAEDATGRIYESPQTQVVNGQAVTRWIEVNKRGNSGKARYYPVFPEGAARFSVGDDGAILGGWDHEECTICRGHVDAGEYGYVDPSDHWVCETCYSKFVSTHDLSFI